jgi:hypothetical protein
VCAQGNSFVDTLNIVDNLRVSGFRRMLSLLRGVPSWSIQLQCSDMVMTDNTCVLDYPFPTDITVVNVWAQQVAPLIVDDHNPSASPLAMLCSIKGLVSLIIEYANASRWLTAPAPETPFELMPDELFPIQNTQ